MLVLYSVHSFVDDFLTDFLMIQLFGCRCCGGSVKFLNLKKEYEEIENTLYSVGLNFHIIHPK